MTTVYQRLFYIFKNMDSSYGYSSNPSGYLRVEINGCTIKLQAVVQNLCYEKEELSYSLYAVSCSGNHHKQAKLCELPLSKGKADIRQDITEVLEKHKLNFSDINVLAVISVSTSKFKRKTMCPLVAYPKGEVEWRSKFERILENGGTEEYFEDQNHDNSLAENESNILSQDNSEALAKNESDLLTQDSSEAFAENESDLLTQDSSEAFAENESDLLSQDSSQALADSESDILSHDSSEAFAENESDLLSQDSSQVFSENESQIFRKNEITEDTFASQSDITDAASSSNINELNAANTETVIDCDDATACEYEAKLIERALKHADEIGVDEALEDNTPILTPSQKSIAHLVEEKLYEIENASEQNNKKKIQSSSEKIAPQQNKDIDTAFPMKDVWTKIQQELWVKERESEKEVTFDEDILQTVERNYQDLSSFGLSMDVKTGEINLDSLKEDLDRCFESYNPFKGRIKGIHCWKINSPGYLNNLLFKNNIKTYLLFNPKVLLANFKYRHVLFGMQMDKGINRFQLICGVPGVYNIDDNPFSTASTWIQLDGVKPKYGAFGYWLVLIDARSGKIHKLK